MIYAKSSGDLPTTFKEGLAQMVSTDILANRYPNGIYQELNVGLGRDGIAPGNGSDELICSLLLVSVSWWQNPLLPCMAF